MWRFSKVENTRTRITWIIIVTDFFLLAFVFLLAGVASVPIASRTGLGSVLGYLIAGIAISLCFQASS